MNRGLQERFEANPLGRSVITGVILFILLALLSSNVPDSELRQQVTRLVSPARDAVGLDQTWSVFAPNPRSRSLRLDARIRYTDGSLSTWTTPSGDVLVAGYRFYRWRKYAENARQDKRRGLWAPLAIWIARQHDGPTKHPIDVTLIRAWQQLRAPGSRVLKEPWREEAFFTIQITPAMLESV